MLRAVSALTLAAALVGAAPSAAQDAGLSAGQTYRLQVSVVHDGVAVAAVDTQILEQAPTEVTILVDNRQWAFNADLFVAQGDGSADVMVLEAQLSHDGRTIAAPRLTFMRGHGASIQLGGSESLVSLTVSPLD